MFQFYIRNIFYEVLLLVKLSFFFRFIFDKYGFFLLKLTLVNFTLLTILELFIIKFESVLIFLFKDSSIEIKIFDKVSQLIS